MNVTPEIAALLALVFILVTVVLLVYYLGRRTVTLLLVRRLERRVSRAEATLTRWLKDPNPAVRNAVRRHRLRLVEIPGEDPT